MPTLPTYAAAAFLALHGVVHLLGTAVYLGLVEAANFPYKTTLLGSRWDVGVAGIRVFGVLWAVAAVGFVASAVTLVVGWNSWRALLVAVALFSLVLTALDWSVAYAGVVVNLGILVAVVVVVPRL